MKPENKCVDLEHAKKLKEAGIEIETERYWWAREGFIGTQLVSKEQMDEVYEEDFVALVAKGGLEGSLFLAPDVSELLNYLPYRIEKETGCIYLEIKKYREGYKIAYICKNRDIYFCSDTHKNLSNALAELVIITKGE